jgi:aspartate/methionine/tyrosine aminotransferase
VYNKYIFVDSFSKKFAMTGWRLGYVVAHPEIMCNILKASQLTITHVAPFIQMAGLAALNLPSSINYAELMKITYNERLKDLKAYCDELKLEYLDAKGAFYLFIKLSNGIDDVIFCDDLLAKKNICIVPGSAFGNAGKGYVRISYANETAIVKQGIYIMAKFMNTYK